MNTLRTSVELAREPISAFIICCNEEKEIGDCLESLRFCDEIIVVDSFSSDNTVSICEEFGATVIQREWPGYKAQKTFALASTSNEWVINLDADERVSPELRQNILKILEEERQIQQSNPEAVSKRPNAYEVNRVVFYLGRWWRKGGWYPEYRVRLLRKSKIEWGGTDPHERPIVFGKVARLSGELEHFTYRSMDEQVRRLHSHATIAAQQEFESSNSSVGLSKILINPTVRMVKFYFLKKGYREGLAGVIVAIMEGFYTFLKYSKVWEFQQKSKGNQ